MSARPQHPRSSCCVPFCRHTSRRFEDEWLCGDHWRLVDTALKRLRTRMHRRWKAAWEKAAATAEAADTNEAHIRRTMAARRWRRGGRAIWRRMKRQAIERAMGISA